MVPIVTTVPRNPFFSCLNIRQKKMKPMSTELQHMKTYFVALLSKGTPFIFWQYLNFFFLPDLFTELEALVDDLVQRFSRGKRAIFGLAACFGIVMDTLSSSRAVFAELSLEVLHPRGLGSHLSHFAILGRHKDPSSQPEQPDAESSCSTPSGPESSLGPS